MASGFIYGHLLATIQEAVIGVAAGIAAGVAIGALFAFSPFLSDLFQPLMVVFNAMPRIALAPLFIVWLGIGLAVWSHLVTPFLTNVKNARGS